jgi:hypothetical protein
LLDGYRFEGSAIGFDVRTRKRFFDQPPTCREARVAIGQRPKRVQMVRKDNVGIKLKRMAAANFVNALHQKRDGLSVAEQRTAIFRD